MPDGMTVLLRLRHQAPNFPSQRSTLNHNVTQLLTDILNTRLFAVAVVPRTGVFAGSWRKYLIYVGNPGENRGPNQRCMRLVDHKQANTIGYRI